ncbi:NUDIX domain-containing protein [Phytoactinopolyspora sp. XMNu-373]|uniref:NUDIX domain-containing protein n=1 Tax=Phytoactinopolyspora mesophila TaxID=2650750 RepID=A0A7K3MBP7_9ACTN|nr:NUDIX domain-containing protein [Phytoactinopolyspora mesophila]
MAPARPASTVVLVRDGDAGIEVYVHQRHPGMAFAGGMVAFPGGSVDPADLEPTGAVDARIWAQRLGTTETAALGFVRAALRETEEETGLRLDAADLVPWAHWITPRFQPRRFDTWFFLARVPAEQQPQDVSGEATAVAWVAARTAIDKAATDEWTMLPPTRAIFEELSAFASVDDLPTDERAIEAITPGWLDLGDSVIALLPDDPRYPGDDPGESERP